MCVAHIERTYNHIEIVATHPNNDKLTHVLHTMYTIADYYRSKQL